MDTKITYRTIAKLFAKAIPGDFAENVSECLEAVEKLPTVQKRALKTAYIFASKVPREEREDMFQDLVLTLLEAQTEERLAYSIARCDWRDWWKRYRTRQHFDAGSLNRSVLDAEGSAIQWGELLVGEAEFENKVNGKLDAKRMLDSLPSAIKRLAIKRLQGFGLTKGERGSLERWAEHNKWLLVT